MSDSEWVFLIWLLTNPVFVDGKRYYGKSFSGDSSANGANTETHLSTNN